MTQLLLRTATQNTTKSVFLIDNTFHNHFFDKPYCGTRTAF